MKLLWLGYLVYILGNCIMKLCIESGLNLAISPQLKHLKLFRPHSNLVSLAPGPTRRSARSLSVSQTPTSASSSPVKIGKEGKPKSPLAISSTSHAPQPPSCPPRSSWPWQPPGSVPPRPHPHPPHSSRSRWPRTICGDRGAPTLCIGKSESRSAPCSMKRTDPIVRCRAVDMTDAVTLALEPPPSKQQHSAPPGCRRHSRHSKAM